MEQSPEVGYKTESDPGQQDSLKRDVTATHHKVFNVTHLLLLMANTSLPDSRSFSSLSLRLCFFSFYDLKDIFASSACQSCKH